jgi:integrase
LRRADVNFHVSTIYISNGKHYKDRRLPVGEQVMEMCRKYDRIIDAVTPNRAYFFQSSTGRAYSNVWLSRCFQRCWTMGNGDGGRICTAYSLRHRYATDTLAQWMEEGKDLDAWLPYLSAYMGHGSFSATYSYVHLMPERLARLEAMRIIGIIPEVADVEKDA